MTRRGLVAAFAAACLGLPLAAPAQSAAPAVRCDFVGFSPAFTQDRTAFCAMTYDSGMRLYRSTDGGRSWAFRAEASAPTDDPRHRPTAVIVDPYYPSTRTVYVMTTFGLYRAEQDGAAVSLAGAGEFYRSTTTPYVEGLPGGTEVGRRLAFTFASLSSLLLASQYDSGTGRFRTIVGGPANNARFFVPPDFAERRHAYALAQDLVYTNGNENSGYAVFACTGEFVCTEKVHSFGPNVGVTPSAGSLPGGVEWMVLRPHRGMNDKPSPAFGHYFVLSRDGGRTWGPWASATALLPPEARDGRLPYPTLHITASPDAPNRFFLHLVLNQWARKYAPSAPASQLFRSDDAGKTWKRIGYARAPEQAGKDRGNLPWNDDLYGAGGRETYALPGGRLYVAAAHKKNATTVTYQGLYCSADLGRTWRRGGGC